MRDHVVRRRRRRRRLPPVGSSKWTLMLLFLACANQSSSFSFMSNKRHQLLPFRNQNTFGPQSEHTRRPKVLIAPLLAGASPSSSSAPAALNLDISYATAVIDFYSNLDRLYDKSISIKCPFFRRRAADLIDGAAMIVQFLLVRHKSLPGISDLFLNVGPEPEAPSSSSSVGPSEKMLSLSSASLSTNSIASIFSAPGCKPLGRHIKRHPDGTAHKTRGLTLEEISHRIRSDWTEGSAGEDRGYYITGKLDSTIYRDDCLFTGPDPDMPVRGLRKYLSAAAHLFDPRQSHAELLSFDYHEGNIVDNKNDHGFVEARWRLGGVIQLPWHPTVEPWTGITKYHLDEEGLVYWHEEEWDISVWRAFICTLFPEAKTWNIWGENEIVQEI